MNYKFIICEEQRKTGVGGGWRGDSRRWKRQRRKRRDRASGEFNGYVMPSWETYLSLSSHISRKEKNSFYKTFTGLVSFFNGISTIVSYLMRKLPS